MSGFFAGLDSLLAFSHHHCIAICAFLVPANLSATLASLVLAGQAAPRKWLRWTVGLAVLFACTLLLHVLSWFLIGVVMPPTYILLTLATVCLGLNAWACTYPQWLIVGWQWGQRQWGKHWQYM